MGMHFLECKEKLCNKDLRYRYYLLVFRFTFYVYFKFDYCTSRDRYDTIPRSLLMENYSKFLESSLYIRCLIINDRKPKYEKK